MAVAEDGAPPARIAARPALPAELPVEVRRAILEQRRETLLELAFRAEVEIEVVRAQPHRAETVTLQRGGRPVEVPTGEYLRDQQDTADNARAAAHRLGELLANLGSA